MIFFNFETIWLLALGNSELIVKLFHRLVNKDTGYKVLEGKSYIVNPQVITENPYNLNYQQLAEYLGILSLRNYQHYIINGNTDLDMAYIPEYIEPTVVTNNPLIEINQSNLIFKKEKICL